MSKSILADKSLDFAVKIVKFYKYLCEEKKEFVLSKQMLRSGTSIGANIRECNNAQSSADFISKLTIALKEADETEYWITLLEKSEIVSSEEVKVLNLEVREIIAMLTASIKTKKANEKRYN